MEEAYPPDGHDGASSEVLETDFPPGLIVLGRFLAELATGQRNVLTQVKDVVGQPVDDLLILGVLVLCCFFQVSLKQYLLHHTCTVQQT